MLSSALKSLVDPSVVTSDGRVLRTPGPGGLTRGRFGAIASSRRQPQGGRTPMKSMRAHQFGGPEQLRFEDAPDPQPQAGPGPITVRAAGTETAGVVPGGRPAPARPHPPPPRDGGCGGEEAPRGGGALGEAQR